MTVLDSFALTIVIIVCIALYWHFSIKKGLNHWLAMGIMIGSVLIASILAAIFIPVSLEVAIFGFVLVSIGGGTILLLLNPKKV